MDDFQQVRKDLIGMLEDIDDKLKLIDQDAVIPFSSENKIEANSVDDIKQAISRIDKGTYGVCLNCGQLIPKEGLKAKPLSRLCSCCTNEQQA